MPIRTSPTVRRRRLAKELKRLRKDAGRNRDEVASFVGCAPATVTKIEAASSAAPPAYVALMLEMYGVTGERREVLMTLARQAKKRGWWHQYGGAIPQWFEVYVGLEEEVAEVRTYQNEAVYGLLQTEAYMRALMLADVDVPSEDEVERQVALRLKRQERLRADDSPKIGIVLNESVLRRSVGGAHAMKEQLGHLMDVSRLNNVLLQVLTYSAGAHPAMDGAFEVLRFPEPADPDVAYIQYRRGSIYVEDQADVDAYNELFEHLRARALGPDESRTLIGRVADEMF